jgi:hypothetical protein
MVKVKMGWGCRLNQAASEVRVAAAMRQGKSRHVVAASSACFDVRTFRLDAFLGILSSNQGAVHGGRVESSANVRRALHRLSIDTPHRPRPACRRRVQSLMLPSPKLRITLLHLAPKTPLVVSHSEFISSRIRTMATKPSLKAAEDFLSFVNASPTRKSRAIVAEIDTHCR